MLEALLAFLGAALGGFVGLISVKRTIYNDSVSQSRNTWLNEMREYISQMLACKKVVNDFSNNNVDVEKYTEKYEAAKNQVLIRLNMTEEKHMLLHRAIMDLDTGVRGYDDVAPKIIEIARSILKEEWEKVKSETKGGK